MKTMWTCILVLAGLLVVSGVRAAEDEGGLTIEVGNAITMGGLTVQDVEIDVETEAFNPRLGVEYSFAGSPVSIGADLALSENTFTGTWEGDDEGGDGSLDVERTDIGVYARLGSRDGVNLKVGYRNFSYEYSNGELAQYENGRLTERDENANATSDLTTGIDAELNLVFGEDFQVAFGIGYSFFMDAQYDWEYDQTVGGRTTHVVGSAELDAHSARFRPEISFLAAENLRVYLNYTVQASIWTGDFEGGDTEDYPALDLYSAAGVGVRYTFPL